MRPNYTHILFDLLESHEVNVGDLLRGLGVSGAQVRGDAALTRAQFSQLLERAVAYSGMPGLVLEFGSKLNVGSHGVIGYALMSSATVAEALDIFMHYYKLLVPEAEIHLLEGEGKLRLMCEVPGVPQNVERHTLESVFASFYTTARFLINRPLPQAELFLQYAQPHYAHVYAELFGFPVHFSAQSNYLSLNSSVLHWPLETHHPSASGIFREQCDALLAPILDEAVTANRVRQLLLVRHGKLPNLSEVSEQLHMSERSLKRRLAAEGSCFRKLVDQVKARLAGQYLDNTGLTVSEVAALVGYDDVSNFRTAFRRWFDTTPQCYRSRVGRIPEGTAREAFIQSMSTPGRLQ